MKEITIIHGFGIKHYDSAIYVDGKLFSGDADFNESEALIKLIKKMAKDFSVRWIEFTAPEVFRLTSYYNIPKTLDKYAEEAIDLFKQFSTFESIEESIYYAYPIEQYQEKSIISQVYMLSGGLEKNCKEFYENIYQPKFPEVEGELEKEYAYLNGKRAQSRYDSREKQEEIYEKLVEVSKKLEERFKEQLQFVWNYDKPLHPFKKLALKTQGVKLK